MNKKVILSAAIVGAALTGAAAQQAETLDRGAIALKTEQGVFVSWRAFATDAKLVSYDVYRDGTKVNAEPLLQGTNFTDPAGTAASKYTIKSSTGEEFAALPTWGDVYSRIHLDRPAAGSNADGSYTYSPNDMSVGDVDGDGQYELFVKWDPSNSKDNSQEGLTGNVYIDCYRLDGTKLWRIDLGRNIRAGAHYTQYQVYDFDGDGKAELICKTAPGTIDGQGKAVLMGNDKVTDDYVTKSGSHTKGTVRTGSEYLTCFSGLTGAELSTIAYNPPRSIQSNWGDSYGNRSERYLSATAYLDGEHPSAVFCRGYYTHSYLWAVDFKNGQLTERWLHASTKSGQGAYGEGAHSLTVGDVDGDGRDEIVYGSACIDDNGSLLYRTGFGHGDALHLGKFDPDREGFQVYMVHEEKGSGYKYDTEFRDAKTGQVIWGHLQSGNDIGRGMIADVSSLYRGYESWSQYYPSKGADRENCTWDAKGNRVANRQGSQCFRLYWDGDLQDELFDGKFNSDQGKAYPIIEKIADNLGSSSTLVNFAQWNAQSCNTTKATPCLSADILGDWREEVILWDYENPGDILLFSTPIASQYRVPCLMTDHHYRMAIAWQNVGYNQPPHLGYYLPDLFSTDARFVISEGMTDQIIDLGYEIIPLKGQIVNATTLEATGLPEGVVCDFNEADKTFEVHGKPAAKGEYAYRLVAKGAESQAVIEGVITVKEAVSLTKICYYPFESSELASETKAIKYYNTANAANGSFGEIVEMNGRTHALVPGVKGNALQLQFNVYVRQQPVYEAMQLGEKDFSVEMWIKSADATMYLWQVGMTDDYWAGLEVKNGLLKFAVDDDVYKSEANCDAEPILDDQWHHVVCVRDHTNKTLNIYIDGELAGQGTDDTGSISSDLRICVGNVSPSLDNYITGLVDEFSVYEGAMSISQVQDNYNALKGAGIEEITVSPVSGPARLTVVDAVTGQVVRTAVGMPSDVTSGLAKGVYLLVIQNGLSREVRKFVQK